MQPQSPHGESFMGGGWIVLLRGVTAIAFAVIAFAWPPMTNAKLALLFGLYALVHGTLSLIAAIGGRGRRGSWLLANEGVIGLFAGLLTLRTPSPGPMAAVFFVWLWAIAAGILRIAEAIRLRKEISGEIWLMLSGLVTVLFGLILLLRPIVGVIGMALLTGGFALVWGVFEILLGRDLRAARHGWPADRT